jgi:hypothetical protein
MNVARCVAVAALLAGFAGTPVFASDLNPVAQREQQKRVKAEVEQTARRISTTLRVLAYQKMDAGTEQKLLDEVAATLRGLSQEQMAAVIAHLEASLKAPDEATATAEQREAYQKHRQIITSLRGLLTKLDVIKSLDMAAARLDKMAKEQHTLHLRALQSEAVKTQPRPGRRSTFTDDREEQADSQGDLRTSMTDLVRQLAVLRPTLDQDQKDRLERADVAGKGGRLIADMELAVHTLNAGRFSDAAERQLRTSKELQALAAALRSPRDKIAAMREARDRIEKAIREQEAIKAETQKQPETPAPQRDRFRQDPTQVHAQQLAEQEARLEFDTREIRRSLENVAKEVAEKLTPAESEMRRAQEELRRVDLESAVEPQENAADRLREARDELDRQIAAAEQERADPLAAAKKAAELVDRLLEEQKRVREMTQNESNPANLPPVAEAQREVARATEEVRNLPLPESQPLREALNQAADQTKQAADELAVPDKQAAEPRQDDAIKALEAAKKALEDKAAEIEKRREDIAKLDDARERLDELARQEKQLANDAKAMAGDDNPPTDQLAKKQEQLTPPTREIGNEVRDAAPEAANKVEQAAQRMEAARDNLQAQQAQDGSNNAQEAAKKLDEAIQELARRAEDLKAQEIAEQAALQPNQVNPADAAQQLAKAIEQAEMAAEQANRAAEQLGKQSPQNNDPMAPGEMPNLAELQRQIAEQAKRLQRDEAAQPAQEAAQALENRDLQTAMELQRAALERLNEAAQAAGQPMPGENAQPMPGQQGQQGEPGQQPQNGPPSPANAQNPGQLAQQQQQVLEATEALARSAQANQAAQAALNQAQAHSPQAVQPQLNQAGQQLAQAGQQLQQGQPAQAGQNQQQAADQLSQALRALNQAAQAMGQPGQQPGQPQQAQAQQPGQPGQQPGQPGQQPGQQQAQAQQPGQTGQQPGQQPGQPGQSQERNQAQGEGNREGISPNRNTASSGQGQQGDGTFINLQKRERDKVQQNAEAAFPAEFRELIKQYNINIKNTGKPQTGSADAPTPAGK